MTPRLLPKLVSVLTSYIPHGQNIPSIHFFRTQSFWEQYIECSCFTNNRTPVMEPYSNNHDRTRHENDTIRNRLRGMPQWNQVRETSERSNVHLETFSDHRTFPIDCVSHSHGHPSNLNQCLEDLGCHHWGRHFSLQVTDNLLQFLVFLSLRLEVRLYLH